MTVFTCGNCGAVVTAEVSEVAFREEPAVHDDRGAAPSRIPPGAFTRDPDRFGPPFEPTPDDPKLLVSDGPALTRAHPICDIQTIGWPLACATVPR